MWYLQTWTSEWEQSTLGLSKGSSMIDRYMKKTQHSKYNSNNTDEEISPTVDYDDILSMFQDKWWKYENL